MSWFVGTAQIAIAVVLLAAAGGKIVKGRELGGALRLSRVPAFPARILSVLVPAMELCLGVLVLVMRGGALQATLVACALMLGAFSAWLVWVRVENLDIRCSCFGASKKVVTPATVARNLLLVGVAAVAAFGAGTASSVLPSTSVYWAIASAGFASVVLLFAGFNQIKGQLILSLETMKRRRDMASGIEV